LIVYFDTSALVPIVIEEDSSENCGRLWDLADRVVSSRLVYAEGRAALAQARRIGRLSDKLLREAVRNFEDLVDELDAVEVTAELVHRAGALAEKLGLRGYDAIHLASAEAVNDRDLVLATGDRALLQAARSLGLRVANLDNVEP
jgi:predicted nucleic acid-binding protein